jgi:Icc-related predicted phosphoesterase
VIRLAAFGDCHVGTDSRGLLRPHLDRVGEHADALLVAGDLTKCGTAEEAEVFADELDGVRVPVFAVLGNHDHHGDEVDAIMAALEARGVRVLEGEADTLDVRGTTVGVAGAKGFGGGFPGAGASEFGEAEMKAFVRHTRAVAGRLREALGRLRADVRIALLHYSPVEATLLGERLEIYPFLGSYLLAEAVDAAGADLVLHGHAHAGSETGTTPGGIAVRNVAQPVIRHAYKVVAIPAPSVNRVQARSTGTT